MTSQHKLIRVPKKQHMSTSQEAAFIRLKSCLQKIDPEKPISEAETAKLSDVCQDFCPAGGSITPSLPSF